MTLENAATSGLDLSRSDWHSLDPTDGELSISRRRQDSTVFAITIARVSNTLDKLAAVSVVASAH